MKISMADPGIRWLMKNTTMEIPMMSGIMINNRFIIYTVIITNKGRA